MPSWSSSCATPTGGPPDQPQPYALAVVLEAAEDMLTLYDELELHFEALVEIEPEVEIG